MAGITVSVDEVTVTDFYGTNYLKWQFAQDYWFYNFYVPQVSLATLPTAPYNETHWDNSQYNSLYAQAIATTTRRSGPSSRTRCSRSSTTRAVTSSRSSPRWSTVTAPTSAAWSRQDRLVAERLRLQECVAIVTTCDSRDATGESVPAAQTASHPELLINRSLTGRLTLRLVSILVFAATRCCRATRRARYC